MTTRIQIMLAQLMVGALFTGMVLAQNTAAPGDQKAGSQTNGRTSGQGRTDPSTVSGNASILSADEKAALYDRLSEADKLASMRKVNKDSSKMSAEERKTMLGKMTTQEKATAYDQLKPDQQNKLRMDSPNNVNGGVRNDTRNPNNPNARDGQTPGQTRNPNAPTQPGDQPTTPQVPTPGGAPPPGR